MKSLLIFTLMAVSFLACQQADKELPELPKDGIAMYYDSARWPFYHGVASGDPLADRVIIWTRITPKDSLEQIEVKWEVATDPDFESIVNSESVTTTPAMDYTVKVDVNKLNAGTKYFYRFKALDKISSIGKTKTAPDAGVQTVNFAIASCSNYEFGSFKAYQAIADIKNLDAVIHLGDYIYEYGPGSYGDSTSGRVHFPQKELITLQDYRLRYSQYRLDPNLAAAHQNHPFITIWDDHEIANNSFKDGAQNHQQDEGDYQQRLKAARKAYYEWLPVRNSDQLYRSFSYGSLADLIMLDERLAGRTAPPDSINDPQRADGRMLGEKQMNWFLNKLKSSEARWKVIGNQVIFSYLNWGHASFNINLDCWDGYPAERDSIKSLIIGDSIKNVVFITGDTHSSWAFEVTDDPFSNYNPENALGAFAVEFGTTSINSGNSNERFPTDSVLLHEQKIVNSAINPHLKYANLRDHGFLKLTLTQERATAEWNFVNLKSAENEIVDRKSVFVKSDEVLLRKKN